MYIREWHKDLFYNSIMHLHSVEIITEFLGIQVSLEESAIDFAMKERACARLFKLQTVFTGSLLNSNANP